MLFKKPFINADFNAFGSGVLTYKALKSTYFLINFTRSLKQQLFPKIKVSHKGGGQKSVKKCHMFFERHLQ